MLRLNCGSCYKTIFESSRGFSMSATGFAVGHYEKIRKCLTKCNDAVGTASSTDQVTVNASPFLGFERGFDQAFCDTNMQSIKRMAKRANKHNYEGNNFQFRN